MKSAVILAAGIAALGLLAALCLPRHVPPSTALGPAAPANFHARVEYGMLILRGSLPSETSKTAILQRAQELYGTTPGHVVDELAVDPRVGPVAWADNVSQVLPVLGHMTERGSIIIDGHTIVVSGKVDSNRAKATVLQVLAPLTQTGLELEDRILAGSSTAGRPTKASSPTTPSQKAPSLKTPVLVASPSPSVPSTTGPSQKALSLKTPSQSAVEASKAPSPAAPSPKTHSLVAALAPKAPFLPAAPSVTEVSPAMLQKRLSEILARSSIEFESNSTTMTPPSLATLDQLMAELRRSPHTAVEIGGHTDKYGEPEYNLQLSQRRADAVRRYFAKHGLPKQFTAVGYGASRPLSVAENRAGLQRNRRIELRVKGQPEL
jgi:outer membrane protein OmpA-like peptidoglycan-associated protein